MLLTFQFWFKKCLGSLWGNELLSTLQPLSHRQYVVSISLFYHYFHGKCPDKLHSLVTSTLTLSAKFYHAAYIETNQPHFLRIPSVGSKFHSDSFFPKLLPCRTEGFQEDSFPVTTMLTSSNLDLTIIFPYILINCTLCFYCPHNKCLQYSSILKKRYISK